MPYQVDFTVPGVTSISCDPHKYAYGPKGCSIAMFRHRSLREAQLYCNTTWQGGIYATTCIAGSRPGQTIVGTWASMLKHGKKGASLSQTSFCLKLLIVLLKNLASTSALKLEEYRYPKISQLTLNLSRRILIPTPFVSLLQHQSMPLDSTIQLRRLQHWL